MKYLHFFRKYLHVYRTESGKWCGLVLEVVGGVYDRATPLEVLLDAREQHPDVIDLPGAKAVENMREALHNAVALFGHHCTDAPQLAWLVEARAALAPFGGNA